MKDKTSRNGISIGQKLLLSYMILLLITFSIVAVSFTQLTRAYVFDSAEAEISARADRIAKVVAPLLKKMNTVKRAELSEEIVNNVKVRISGLILNSEAYVVNNNFKIIYGQGKLRLDKVKRLIEDDSFAIENTVDHVSKVVFNEEKLGYVLVVTKVEDIRELNKTARSFMLIALGISAVLAVFIGFVLQKKITGPIKELREEFVSYKNEDGFIDENSNLSNDELEDLKNAFENMIKRVDIYTDNQKAFFQNASHELKTPLMSIQGYAEAVRDGIVEGDEVEKSLNIIISESQRLKKIVEEMILITKLDDANEKFKFANHSTMSLINESLNALNPLLHINSVEIDVIHDKDVTICVDSEKFKRALINIIGNSCRYARSNITISFAELSGRLYLDIKDDGHGFNPGEEKLVFERFYKGEKGGSGIGLTLSKTIINRHGGELLAVNNIGMGALFKIDIPIDGNCN